MGSISTYVQGSHNLIKTFRNEHIEKNDKSIKSSFTKTGTTIVGVKFKGGVVLGADSRATGGPVIVDQDCMKIHYIAPNMACCGAGTAADLEFTTRKKLNSGLECKVIQAATRIRHYLFPYQGYISAALILGGVDSNGPQLYNIYPHGSGNELPFATMGSGSLAAMSMLETEYRDEMTEEEATSLVIKAVKAGIFNDLGSGSNVNIEVIKRNVDGIVERSQMHIVDPLNEVENYRKHYTRPKQRKFGEGATGICSINLLEVISETIELI